MPRNQFPLNRLFLPALLLGMLVPARVHALQDSNTLAFGPIVVELKRVNTISGGANANVLYGTFAPGDDRLFLVQQGSPSPSSLPGRIRVLDPSVVDGEAGTLLDFNEQLPGFLDTSHFEKGLLGLAFHPDFNDAGKPGYLKFYTYSSERFVAHGTVDFTHPETGTNFINHLAVLREWTADSITPTSAAPSRVILTIAEPQNQHNAGTIAFSPADGYLYWALGDGGGNSSTSPDFFGSITNLIDGHSNSGGPGMPHGNGQDRTTPLGSMLRINPLSVAMAPDPNALPSANGQYQIPTNNPFTMDSNINPLTHEPYPDWTADWADEIFAYGLRNPYRFSFDRGGDALDPDRGTLYEGDAGYNGREEVNRIVRGGNYGWVIREGTRNMEGVQGIPAYTPPVNAATGMPDALIDPIAEYDASNSATGVGRAIIGGFVYRGSRIPALFGKYVFGEYNTRVSSERGILFYLDLDETKEPSAPFTIYRLGVGGDGDSKPAADLLGFGEGADGEIYAFFDNGEIVTFDGQTAPPLPLRIAAEIVSGNELRLRFATQNGKSYRVEHKASLDDPEWNELIQLPGTGQPEQVIDWTTNRTEGYYRVVVE